MRSKPGLSLCCDCYYIKESLVPTEIRENLEKFLEGNTELKAVPSLPLSILRETVM